MASLTTTCGPKGEHTQEVFAEAGLDAGKIGELLEAGAVQDHRHG
jgi:hypothetical protein